MGASSLVVAVAFLSLPAVGLAQTTGAGSSSSPSQREKVTVGFAGNLATDIDGLWLSPGFRVTAPLGPRTGVDFEWSAVFGGRNPAPSGSITKFYALNFRRLRAPRTNDGSSDYWIYGLRYTPINWPAPRPSGSYEDDLALTIGHGWDQVVTKGVRCGVEIGFSGGNGFLFFGTFVVGLPVRR